MKIFIATDHKGFQLKEKIKEWLFAWHYEVEDFGALQLDPDDDYPDFISKAAQAVSKDPAHARAIILGSTGQGEAMLANKYPGVLAVVYYGGPEDIIRLSREHNNANVLSLGASFLDEKNIQEMIKLWLQTNFSEGQRHVRRLDKIKEIEESL